MKSGLISLMISLLISTTIYGQGSNKRHRDPSKMERFYKTFVSEELGLSASEMENIWPIYQKYENQRRALSKEQRQLSEEVNNSAKLDMDDLVKRHMALIQKEGAIRIALILELRTKMTDKQVLKLEAAEYKFKKKLLEKVKSKRSSNK